MLVDQLREVFVAGGDDALHAILSGLLRQRADHIVGFHAVYHRDIPAVRRDKLMQRCYLQHQVVRHARARRFVFWIPIVAEGFTFCVKYAQAIIRRVIGAQLAQHIQHAVHRTGRKAFGIAHIRHRVERPVQE